MSHRRTGSQSEKKDMDPEKKKQLTELLREAILRGDLKEVQAIVAQGYDVSKPIDESGQTVLHEAAYSGQAEIIVYFMEDLPADKRPNVNSRDSHGWTPLLCASSIGNIRLCYYLLQRGADPSLVNDQRTSALHYLCRKIPQHDKNPLPTMVEAKKKSWSSKRFSEKDRELDTYYEVLDMIVDKGIDVNSKNYLGETPLMQAASKGNEDAVKWLLDHKADYKDANLKGETALFYAERHPNIVKLLNFKMEGKKKELRTHDIRLDHYEEVVPLMIGDNGVALSEKKSFFITYRDCFAGTVLVDWILKNLAIRTRDEAVAYSQKLLDSHWIESVKLKKTFKDKSTTLYRFSTGKAPTQEEESKRNIQTSITVDDFIQLKVLGRGAFGKVVLVKKKDDSKYYAMKVIEKSKIMEKPRDFKNLMSEKRILQNDCPFLVHLHYAFQNDTDFFLVMDFLGGGDLNYHLKQQRRFPERVVQFIAAELILALDYMHSCGIIYRDLKPQNILIDVDGHVCLADFGLSKEVNSSDAGMHTACGTPSYSAPEVLEGNAYSKSIDWWSFGICLYQFLVGRPPFQFDGDFAKLVNTILTEELTYSDDYFSEKAKSFIGGLLQKDPKKRLDDVDTMKRHPFFTGIDWQKLEVKKLTPPLKISNSASDNFDPKYTRMPLSDPHKTEKAPQAEVEGFTWIK